MAIEFYCECGRHFRVRDEQAGRRAKCPNCGRQLTVPAPEAAPAESDFVQAESYPPGEAYPGEPEQVYPGVQYPPAQYPAAQQYAAPPHPSAQFPQPQYPAGQYPPQYPQGQDPAQQPAQGWAGQPPPAGGGYAPTTPEAQQWPPQPVAYASASPYSARARRAKNAISEYHSIGLFVVLGVALLLGFLLPIIVPTLSGSNGAYYLNFKALSEDNVSASIKAICVAPLAAGIVVLVLAGLLKGVVRGAILFGLGVVPFALLFLDKDVQTGVLSMISSDRENEGIAISAILATLAWVLMIGSILGLRHRPDFRPLVILALIGSVLYALYLFLPLGPGKGIASLPLIATFEQEKVGTMSTASATFATICAVLAMLCTMGMAIICIGYGASNRMTRRRAQIALGLFIGSVGMLVLQVTTMLSSVGMESQSGVMLSVMFLIVKMLMWLGGLLFMIPVGLSEFLLGLAARGRVAQSTTRGFPVQAMAAGAAYSQYPQGQYQQGG